LPRKVSSRTHNGKSTSREAMTELPAEFLNGRLRPDELETIRLQIESFFSPAPRPCVGARANEVRATVWNRTGEATLDWMVMEDDWKRRLDLSASRTGIGRALRAIHSDVMNEPLPDRLAELLRQLDERTEISPVQNVEDA
jgi:hypothetical protein